MKYLVLVGDRNGQFFYNIKDSINIRLSNIYVNLSYFKRVLRVFLNKFNLPVNWTYAEWKFLENDYDKIIIEDATIDKRIFKFLRHKFPNSTIVYWFRNSLDAVDYVKSKNRHLEHGLLCDYVVSFDKNDCAYYNFKYVENCYARDNALLLNIKSEYDMIFLGTDKSRYEIIMNVIHYSEQLNWHNYIHIYSYTRKENNYITNRFMAYKSYLELLVKSKVILDIVDTSYQNGYSLRVFESLFYSKKLITNAIHIKQEPFYNPNNIFVIDFSNEKPFDGLKSFLEIPYINISEDILSLYDFESWLKRI